MRKATVQCRTIAASFGVVLAFCLHPDFSSATSCVIRLYQDWGFISGEGEIPRNSRGLLWWGVFSGSVEEHPNLPVEISDISGELLPIEYEPFPGSESDYRVHDPTVRGNRSLWLFRPQGGFKLGKIYLFTSNRTWRFRGRLHSEEQNRKVTVSRKPAVSPVNPINLDFDLPTTADVKISSGINCGSTEVSAAQIRASMDLPEELGVFREHLYYETIIDGAKQWTTTSDMAIPVVPGVSWQGHSVDLVYVPCEDHSFWTSVGLSPGRHKIEMHAILAGTSVHAQTSPIDIELRCPQSP